MAGESHMVFQWGNFVLCCGFSFPVYSMYGHGRAILVQTLKLKNGNFKKHTHGTALSNAITHCQKLGHFDQIQQY